MKRFRQLLLALGLAVSLVGLLIYRNEYLKLRSAFNYLDIFSGRSKVNVNSVSSDLSYDSSNSLSVLSEPSPQWVNIGNHYVYSAFNVFVESQLMVVAVGVGPRNNPVEYECHVWYEVADVLISSTGKFGFARHQSSDNLSIFEFFCEVSPKDVKGVPYMLVFINNLNGALHKSFVPVYIPKVNVSRGVGICILPDYVGETKQTLVEFLSFHHSIGVNNFLMYDNGLYHWVMSKAGHFSQSDANHLNIVSLAWNFPYNDFTLNREMVELDCKYRTLSSFSLLAVLNVKQFLLPPTDGSWTSIKTSAVVSSSYKQMRLPLMVCCENLRDDKRAEESWPLILRKTRCEKLNYTGYVLVSSQNNVISNITLTSYKVCSDNQMRYVVYDDTAYNWQGEFLSDSLLKLWNSGRFLVKFY